MRKMCTWFIWSFSGESTYGNTVVLNHFHSVTILLFSSARSRDFDGTPGTSGVNVHNKNSNPIKKILTFSVKDRYQLNYCICIKDFNAETNTSFKLNFFSFFICGCQHHQRKTICIYVYTSDIRQIVGYRTPVFIQRFHWRLHKDHITIQRRGCIKAV